MAALRRSVHVGGFWWVDCLPSGLGSYLLVGLGLVARKPFVIGLGVIGLTVALGAFAYVRRRGK